MSTLLLVLFLANVSTADADRWLVGASVHLVIVWLLVPLVLALMWVAVAFLVVQRPVLLRELQSVLRGKRQAGTISPSQRSGEHSAPSSAPGSPIGFQAWAEMFESSPRPREGRGLRAPKKGVRLVAAAAAVARCCGARERASSLPRSQSLSSPLDSFNSADSFSMAFIMVGVTMPYAPFCFPRMPAHVCSGWFSQRRDPVAAVARGRPEGKAGLRQGCLPTSLDEFGVFALDDLGVFCADGGAGAEWPKRPAQLRGPHPLGFLVKDRFPEFREMACKCNGMLPTLNGPPRRSHSLGGGSTYDLAARMMGKTTSMASGATASGTLGDGPHPGAFMRQFFQAVGEVQGHIARGRADVGKMAETVEVALAATSQAQEKEASDILGALTEEVSRSIGAAKEGLKILQERTDQEAKLRPSAQEVKIRNNMQHAMARKHQQLLLEFQRVQTDYKEGLKKRQCRELAILLPESSEKQREEMIQQ
ncbi:unnamed protein product, partial [Prorocentrum cordatum]